jgi:hypothetical protein
MGKRSSFERHPRDLYPTPYSAVLPLLPFLIDNTWFIEPCVGNHDLVRHLEAHGHKCLRWSDHELDARTTKYNLDSADTFITNPPWDRDLLHPIIDNLRLQRPTWLLFDADWMHTKQAQPYLPYCTDIVSVGRVKWIPDSPHTGKDNCCWYRFVDTQSGSTVFRGR